MKIIHLKTVLIFFLFLPLSSYASNYSFLDHSAISHFHGNDAHMMKSNTMRALDLGRKSSWKNPATGSSGYAIPSKIWIQNGLQCRTVTIFNQAHHVTGQSTYQFCKVNNHWKIV